jgi:TPR repeat protein
MLPHVPIVFGRIDIPHTFIIKQQHKLRMLLEGTGVTQQLQEAASLFRIAAEHNIPQAEHFLALMYEYGRGIELSFDMAAYFYRRAAEKNFLESMYNLALMYIYGRGFTQDFQRALPLLQVILHLGDDDDDDEIKSLH